MDIFQLGIIEAPPKKVEDTNLIEKKQVKGNSVEKVKTNINQGENPKIDLESFQGELIIKAYGNELFRVPGPIKEDDLKGRILEKVRNEYGLPEFTKERTNYIFIKENGVVCLGIKFHKKG